MGGGRLYKSNMLGLSIGKILLTAAVIAAVFYGWKWLGRVQAQRPAVKKSAKKRSGGNVSAPPPASDAVDMVQCPICGDFVSANGTRNCGRDDCPYPG